MLRQTPLETTRESRPGEQVNHFLAFAELMLRRGVGELAGGGEAPEPPVTTNDTNLRRSFLTCCLMFVNLTGLRRDLKRDSRQCWWPFPINPQQSTPLGAEASSVGSLPAGARRA